MKKLKKWQIVVLVILALGILGALGRAIGILPQTATTSPSPQSTPPSQSATVATTPPNQQSTPAPQQSSSENGPQVTAVEFESIEMGMTYEEVCAIIGSEGELMSEVDAGIGEEYATEMYKWDGEGSFGANINVTFQGGKSVAKAQFGLE